MWTIPVAVLLAMVLKHLEGVNLLVPALLHRLYMYTHCKFKYNEYSNIAHDSKELWMPFPCDDIFSVLSTSPQVQRTTHCPSAKLAAGDALCCCIEIWEGWLLADYKANLRGMVLQSQHLFCNSTCIGLKASRVYHLHTV